MCVSVCLCVCYHANCYIPHFFVKFQVSLGFPWCFQLMHCVDFAKNALFKSSGNIYWSPLPSLLFGQLSVDKWDSDGFFLSGLMCRTSDSSYNSTDSSLVTVDYQQSSWLLTSLYVAKLLIMHVRHTRSCAWQVMSSRVIAQLEFLWLLQMSRARFAQHCSLKGLSTTLSHYYTTQYNMCSCTGWIACKCAESFTQ